MIPAVLATLGKIMLASELGRRTQVVKGEVCKTSMQRFESARRLQFLLNLITIPISRPLLKENVVVSYSEINVSLQVLEARRFPLTDSYCEPT
jgi:hypothetical protein